MEPNRSPSPRRETVLTAVLTGTVSVFAIALLIALTGGWIFGLVLIVAVLTLLYGFHYVTWGKLMSDAVAGEREEEVLRQRASEEESSVSRTRKRRE